MITKKINFFNIVNYTYLFILVFLNSTIFYNTIAILFVITNLYEAIRNKSKILNPFILVNIIFLVYNLAIITYGRFPYTEESLIRLSILGINLIIGIFLIDFIKRNYYDFIKWFPKLIFIFLIYILVLDFNNLFSGRLAFNLSYPFGILGNYNPNIIGYLITIAIIMLLIRKYLNILFSKREVILILFFLFILALLGGRKTFVFNILLISLTPLLTSNNLKFKIKYFILGITSIIIVLYIVYNIPILYQSIGKRLIDTIISLLSNTDISDGSAYHRFEMNKIAIKYFFESPFIGHGFDSFQKISIYETYSHNNYLEILVSSGILGLSLYMMQYLLVLFNSLKIRNKTVRIILLFSLILLIIFDYYVVSYSSREILLLLYFIYASTIYFKKRGYSI